MTPVVVEHMLMLFVVYLYICESWEREMIWMENMFLYKMKLKFHVICFSSHVKVDDDVATLTITKNERNPCLPHYNKHVQYFFS